MGLRRLSGEGSRFLIGANQLLGNQPSPCRNQGGGNDARLSGDEGQSAVGVCLAAIKNPALRRGEAYKPLTGQSLQVKGRESLFL